MEIDFEKDIPVESVEAYDAFQADPILFFDQILGVEQLEDYQKRVMKAVVENDRVAIRACHDVGKSFLMARAAIWFLNCFPYSKVITTAPTFPQVEKILWAELRTAVRKAKWPLGGKLNLTDWTFADDWFAVGLTTRNESSGGEGQGTSSSFQGYHAPYLLVIFDEATGIPPNLWTMAEGLLTSAHVKFLAIGNPTSSSSEFYRCFKDPAWTKISLNCFDSPNLIANGITSKEKLKAEIEKVSAMPEATANEYMKSYKVVRSYLLSTKWVVQSVRKWGFDHPLTVSKVFGEFPEANDNSLVSLGAVEKAQLRVVWPEASDRKTIGVDVARFGTDSTVLTGMHGKKQLSRKEFFKNDAIQVTGEIINLAKDMGGVDVIVVDETGVGGGVVDLLNDAVGKDKPLGPNCEIRGVQFGAKPNDADTLEGERDREKFVNIKARMFGLLQDDIKSDDGIQLLDEAVYLEELPTILYRYDQKGRMVIESKDDYKKRTGRKSPDNSDSLALANYGRYDELVVGSFSSMDTKSTPSTIAGGMNTNKRSW